LEKYFKEQVTLRKKGIRWKVRNGKNFNFWRDNWMDNRNLVEVLGKDSTVLSNAQCIVSEFIKDNDHWGIDKLRIVINNE